MMKRLRSSHGYTGVTGEHGSQRGLRGLWVTGGAKGRWEEWGGAEEPRGHGAL